MEISSKSETIPITRDEKTSNTEDTSSGEGKFYTFNHNFQVKKNLESPLAGVQIEVSDQAVYFIDWCPYTRT